LIILVREIAERKEKTKEKTVNKRENRGIVFKKKVAIKLFIRRTTMEKVGNKKREEAAPNWFSPQGKE
jgi:hypothetical protein